MKLEYKDNSGAIVEIELSEDRAKQWDKMVDKLRLVRKFRPDPDQNDYENFILINP